MKVLVISHEYPPIGGGGANACYYLTREMVMLNNDVTIVTSSYKDLFEEEKCEGVRIIRVNAKREKEDKSTFVEMMWFLKGAFFSCNELLKREKFDVCLVFFGIPSGPLGLYLRKRYNIPYIVRFGGGDIPGAQKRFEVLYKILTPIIRSIWRNAAALIANSEVLRDKALSFDSRYKISIISNGVDSEFYCKKAENKGLRENISILFVSRLIQGKGLQYIIPQMRYINKKTGAILTVVGDGPYRKELEHITDECGVNDFVVFEGKKNKSELKYFYSNADLFILPSESEGMPNVVLEAMSMGLPIIMTPCGGAKELIDGNGIVVGIDQFCDRIVELCMNESLRVEYGIESARRARTLFSWESRARAYLDIMSESM